MSPSTKAGELPATRPRSGGGRGRGGSSASSIGDSQMDADAGSRTEETRPDVMWPLSSRVLHPIQSLTMVIVTVVMHSLKLRGAITLFYSG